nr:hypothetical protein [Kocuria atrinae]
MFVKPARAGSSFGITGRPG